MTFTLRPLTAILVAAVVSLAGLYLAIQGEGMISTFGWVMAALGVLSVIANLALHRYQQGHG